MTRIVVYRHGLPHAHPLIEAFITGLRQHGIEPVIRGANERPVDADLACFWGHRQDRIIAHQKTRGGRYLVLERGYVGDRFQYTSCGFDGLNGRADFANDGVPGDRWEKLFAHLMQPWRLAFSGEYALILGQVAGDQAVKGVNLAAWYRDVAQEIRDVMGLPARFRPHPQDRTNGKVPGTTLAAGSLHEALVDAVMAVTWNSNSGVDAALAGVPVVAMDQGSMAWPVAAHEIGHIVMPDREDWAARLAHCQWSPDELADGTAWQHLKRGLT